MNTDYNIHIIPYSDSYRDDMIFMVLQAKDALGRIPVLNDDLLNVNKNYIESGNSFYIALNDDNRVVGCVGYLREENASEAFLHRFYIKASEKRKGIGTALLKTVESDMKERGITVSKVHLGNIEYYYESYSFYPKNGYTLYAPSYMSKVL